MNVVSGGAVELGMFLLVGLLGGGHYPGMFGPLVTAYAGDAGSEQGRVTLRDVRQQILLTGGRVGTYAVIGAGVGALALAALGIGTAPAMVGYATVLGAAFLLLGLLPLLHGLALLGVTVPHFQLPHYVELIPRAAEVSP